MAIIKYDPNAPRESARETSKVKSFYLKNDGDEAIVRIMLNSTDEFHVMSVHPIKVADKFRTVNCLRNASDPINVCPFCEAQYQLKNSFYIPMLRYDRNEQGQIITTPVIWERPMGFCNTIRDLINEYGALSDCIFKVKRNGAKGSMQTTYSIMYCSPTVYKPELFPKEDTAFNGYSVLNHLVWNKTAEEILTFIRDGEFPRSNNQLATSTTPAGAPVPNISPETPVVTPPYIPSTVQAHSTDASPWETPTPQTPFTPSTSNTQPFPFSGADLGMPPIRRG